MSARPIPVIKAMACHVCNRITSQVCPMCQCTAYCSAACREKERAEHICKAGGPHKLTDAVTPLDQWRKDHPDGWSIVGTYATCLRSDQAPFKGEFMVLHKSLALPAFLPWDKIKDHIADVAEHSVLVQSVSTRRKDQWNAIVLGYGEGYYHVRFSMLQIGA